MPWPLTKEEMSLFETHGLKEVSLEDFMDSEEPPVLRYVGSGQPIIGHYERAYFWVSVNPAVLTRIVHLPFYDSC